MSRQDQGTSGGTTTNGALNVSVAGNSIVGSGSKTVTTSGTRVQLSAISIPTKKLIVQSMYSNTGNTYVGDSTVSSSNGLVMYPGSATSFVLTPSNLNLIWIDAATNGEGIIFYYEA